MYLQKKFSGRCGNISDLPLFIVLFSCKCTFELLEYYTWLKHILQNKIFETIFF